MTPVFIVISVLCAGLIVWALPGVIRQRRWDVAFERHRRAIARLSDSFNRLNGTTRDAEKAMRNLAALVKEGA